MSLARSTLAVLFVLFLLTPSPGVGPPPGPLPSQVAKWVEELGDDSFRVRQRAAASLRGAGEAAETALELAAKSTDAEVSSKAKEILEEFRWGLYPGTPARVAELVKTYRGSANQFDLKRRDVIKELFLMGPSGARVVYKFTRAEQAGVMRNVLFADISTTITHSMPLLIEENRLDLAEKLLEPGAREGHRPSMANYAALLRMMGKLHAKAAAVEAEAKKAPGDRNLVTLLVYLLRGKDDRAGAAKVAASIGLTDLEEAMLFEAGDWKALHAKPERVNSGIHTRQKGYQAAYARLAGERKEADRILDALADVYNDRLDPLPYAKVMFSNGRADQAIGLLLKNKSARKLAFEALAAQGKWDKAFDLTEAASRASDADFGVLDVLRARERYALGDTEKAAETLRSYADQLRRGIVGAWAEELLQAEVQIGRRAEALVVAARILKHGRETTWPGRTFDKLFPNQIEEAHALWDALLQAHPVDTTENNMTRLDSFLAGKGTDKDLDALLDAGKAKAKGLKQPEADRLLWGLAEAAAGCKKVAQAESCLRGSKLPYALVRWGDLAADEKKWAEAARRYWAAFRQAARTTVPPKRVGEDAKDFVCALALYLHGNALVQDGRPADGKKHMEQAHGLLLADGPQNWSVAKALVARGHREGATRQYLQMSRFCEPVLHEPGAFYSGEGHRGIAMAAMEKKEYLLAADGWERCFLRIMSPTTSFTRGLHYVTSQGYIHQTRARGLVQAGKFDEGKAEITTAREFLPLNTDLGVFVVPALEKKGKQKEADELYKGLQEKLEAVLKAYPKAATVLNRSAWMAACCKRDLARAEKRAREAIKLAPKSPAYHSTLAEVLFQQDKKDAAVKAIEEARRLAPKTRFYERQLKRLKAGDTQAAVPIED